MTSERKAYLRATLEECLDALDEAEEHTAEIMRTADIIDARNQKLYAENSRLIQALQTVDLHGWRLGSVYSNTLRDMVLATLHICKGNQI